MPGVSEQDAPENPERYRGSQVSAVLPEVQTGVTDNRAQELLVLFPPELHAVPVLRFITSGGIGLWRHFGCKLYMRSVNSVIPGTDWTQFAMLKLQ